MEYNKKHGITPKTIVKDVRGLIEAGTTVEDENGKYMTRAEKERLIEKLTKDMQQAAKALEFEYAALLRDRIIELKGEKDAG